MDPSRRWYRLDEVHAPWGDYGTILLTGMTAHQPRTPGGRLRLERTGPFIPPVTLAGAGDLLVTDDFRIKLEKSPLAGLGFRPVEKTRIVRLEWERWDHADDDPQEYPDGGEPEDYILGRPHDPELALQIGPVWEVMLAGRGPDAQTDLGRIPPTRHIWASRRAKDWLEEHAREWIRVTDLGFPP
jgi:hypothetical protein